jgi:SSS family solute:Na+ symporter
MTLTLISGDFMAALVLAAGLAALMSTMDSQLLTLSSIFTRDLLPMTGTSKYQTSLSGRIFVIFLSLAGLALAYKPPATILEIATQTFTGLAVLFPTVLFGLYLKRVHAVAAILSILAGEGAVLLFYFKIMSPGPVLPVVWVMAVAFVVYLVVHVVLSWQAGRIAIFLPPFLYNRYVYWMGVVFILGMDFWAWGLATPMVFGMPAWIGFFILLSLLQTIGMVMMVRSVRISKDM